MVEILTSYQRKHRKQEALSADKKTKTKTRSPQHKGSLRRHLQKAHNFRTFKAHNFRTFIASFVSLFSTPSNHKAFFHAPSSSDHWKKNK